MVICTRKDSVAVEWPVAVGRIENQFLSFTQLPVQLFAFPPLLHLEAQV